MARLLVVEDDADQRELRRDLLARAGYEADAAADAAGADTACARRVPDLVVMDLHLPRIEQGTALIRRLKALNPVPRVVVLTGNEAEFQAQPEAAMVDAVVAKPCRSARLIKIVSRLLAWLVCLTLAAPAKTIPFRVSQPGEVVAEIEMNSPGADWAQPGGEAALATVALDGRPQQHVMLFAGAQRHTYRVFLGALARGEHTLAVERHARYSAPGAGLNVTGAVFAEIPAADAVVANAPVLFARANTIGKFSDVPMLVYCERLIDSGQPCLQYTAIFSNEDGGTSTRALMARWGRTTDIEYIYRVWLDAEGRAQRATIQTRDHKEVEYRARREGTHPVLIPVTDNNMVAPDGATPLRYQLAPVVVKLDGASREEVMDAQPVTYRVMAQELAREGKIRPFGVADGEKISDPRNYLYIEARVTNRDSRSAFLARLKGERRWRVSHLGKIELGIERGGWVRSTIELPPGTAPDGIAEFGFECLTKEKTPAGACRIEEVSKLFFLDRDYRPGAPFWSLREGADVASGEILTWSCASK
ncbi:MAG: response regulator [Acidobacteria bacterium]|nr:response regulator [Acidobacteriota bacterium]